MPPAHSPMTPPLLSRRALNRALLARQMLLAREPAAPAEALRRLAGLQAQQARPPFVGLWSRLSGFRREGLLSAIGEGEVVRATLMRATLHLVTRADYALFRPALQPGLTAAARAALRERLEALPLEAVLEEARAVFRAGPRTFTELRAALAPRFPAADERALGYAVRTHLPLAILPNDHPWGYRADPVFGLADGPDSDEEVRTDLQGLVRRYLAAFGPATVADAQAWSGQGRLRPVMEALRPRLAVFRDERNRELFDLPDAPRPPEETPAPARLVAEFDNLILSHADRTRVIADEHRPAVITKNALVLGTVLADGFVAGTWKVNVARKRATLAITAFSPLGAAAGGGLAEEAEGLLRFLEPEAAGHDLRFEG